MKYSQLISFNPIEDVIQLVTAGNKDKAREYVKTYLFPFEYKMEKETLFEDGGFAMNNFGGELSISLND